MINQDLKKRQGRLESAGMSPRDRSPNLKMPDEEVPIFSFYLDKIDAFVIIIIKKGK
jgi:hypothetical protein